MTRVNWKEYEAQKKAWVEVAGVPARLGPVLFWLHTDKRRHDSDIAQLKAKVEELENQVRTLVTVAPAIEGVRINMSGDFPNAAGFSLRHVSKSGVQTGRCSGRRPKPAILKQPTRGLDGAPWYPPVNRGEWVCSARDVLKEVRGTGLLVGLALSDRIQQLLDQLPQGG
jgi:hypothetical protein